MKDRPNRRSFVRTIALGASTASLGAPASLLADTPEKKDEPRKSEADARMDLVLARFGTHLDDSARKSVRAGVDSIIARAELLRKFPLEYGDGPFFVFRPYREPLG